MVLAEDPEIYSRKVVRSTISGFIPAHVTTAILWNYIIKTFNPAFLHVHHLQTGAYFCDVVQKFKTKLSSIFEIIAKKLDLTLVPRSTPTKHYVNEIFSKIAFSEIFITFSYGVGLFANLHGKRKYLMCFSMTKSFVAQRLDVALADYCTPWYVGAQSLYVQLVGWLNTCKIHLTTYKLAWKRPFRYLHRKRRLGLLLAMENCVSNSVNCESHSIWADTEFTWRCVFKISWQES